MEAILDSPDSPASNRSPARRNLHLGHFAFMRALVQGIDVRAAWDRYLRVEGEYRDARTVNRTISWLRAACAAAARREHRPGTARLVTLDSALIVDLPAKKLPTLDQFVEEQGLEDFAEREQLERYQEQYGSGRERQSKRSRLVLKQLDALRWLENLVAQPPQAGDAIGAWLHPELAAHLQHAQLETLGELVDHINGIGLNWWRTIPAIGKGKAARIVEWLMHYQDSIGFTIGSHALAKRSSLAPWQLARVVASGTALVPLDKFIVPAELDGTRGLYRAPQHLCLMRAYNDFEAVLTWVKSKQGLTPEQIAVKKASRKIRPDAPEGPLDWLQYLSHTQRAYVREAERFILWAVLRARRPLSSMRLEDCQAYRAFLADPAADWCGPRGREKWSPLWRPFEGPLSPRAQAQAVTILKNLYSFLVDQNYLIGNPWKGVARPKKHARQSGIDIGRSFTQEQWSFVENQLRMQDDTSANRRLAFVLHLFYATGLRLSEGLQATIDHLRWVSYPDPEGGAPIDGWQLTVVGKGGKERVVPVSYEVVSELSQYLASRGLDQDPEAAGNAGVHLIGRAVDVAERAPWSSAKVLDVDPRGGISAGTLHAQIKRFFTDCADVMALTDPRSAERFGEASIHWLRHTHGTHAVETGMPLDVVQQNMGHASLDTTTIYVTAEQRRRIKAMAGFWAAAAKRSAAE